MISLKKQFDLSGRTALITGGAGFLGEEFCKAILEMNGNCIVVDNDANNLKATKERLNRLGYRNIHIFDLDIKDENSLKHLSNKILKKGLSIEILINSAALTKSGIEDQNTDFFAPFEKTDQALWEAGLKLNLSATQLTCKVFGDLMSKNGKGSIINIASDIGIVSPNQNIYEPDDFGYDGVDFNSPAFYSVSKAAVIHLTKFLATWWGKKNVRVNCISPAGVYKNHHPGFVKKLSEQIPMGRMLNPEELKGAIVFLASDASSFITGHNLVVDGGRTIW